MKLSLLFLVPFIFSACVVKPIHHSTRYDMSNSKTKPYVPSPTKRY